MTIRLIRNPQTGKPTVVVKLDSDADALPVEHEQLHRELVEKLLGKGLSVEDLGEIVIEREGGRSPEHSTAPVGTESQKESAKAS